jgi:hypothetical protein
MSVTIVQRGLGDKPGSSIVDSVLTDLASRTERGRDAIEETSLSKLLKTASFLVPQYKSPSELYAIYSKGETLYGYCTEFSLNASADENSINISSEIILEVPIARTT